MPMRGPSELLLDRVARSTDNEREESPLRVPVAVRGNPVAVVVFELVADSDL